ncbi:hypothetical protein Q8A73_015770 [Channa argus]|nr:hypothetical protein Q8A73_015770 [Channa argus]
MTQKQSNKAVTSPHHSHEAMLNMNTAAIVFIIPLFWIKGISTSQSNTVRQTPNDALGSINNSVKLTCKHNIKNYDTILWFHRSGGKTSLQLVGYTSYTTVQSVESPYGGSFSVSGNGVSSSKELEVHQSPHKLLKPMNDEIKLTLTHKIPNYNTILWYQRSKGDAALKLIGYSYYKSQNVEASFKGHFNVSGDGENTAHLHILRVKHPEHSAEYFGRVSSIAMQQSLPRAVEEGTEVHISCSHDDSSRPIMLWYQQRKDSQSMALIGFGYGTGEQSYEGDFKEQFELKRESSMKGALIIHRANYSHSAVYFCKGFCHSSIPLCSFTEAHFGAGTRLTVLEPNRTVELPQVKVFQPSPNECRNKKDKTNKKTLVCVASGFYPDHVSVTWQIDGVDVTEGVATDNAAQSENQHYRITSRLIVPLRQWFTPGTIFSCKVGLFNGTETVYRSGQVQGIEGPGADAIREKYLRITHSAKLSYIFMIIKSSIYGVFVVFLVWRLQIKESWLCSVIAGRTEVTSHLFESHSFERADVLVPDKLLPVLKEELDMLREIGVIEPSDSDWSSPVNTAPQEGWQTEVIRVHLFE